MALTIADRTTKSTTYRDPQLGDRWRQLVARLDDVWLKDQTSGWQWEAVDELPVVDGLNGYAWRVDKMRHRIRMADDGGRAWYPRRDYLEFLTLGRIQARVGTNWVDVPLGAPARTGNLFTWDLWFTQGARLRVWITWRSVKFEIEYKDAASARRIRWPVSLTGLVWDGWALRSVSDGQIVGSVQAPWAEDANGTRFSVTPSTYLEASQRYVEFTANLTGAVYPVRIDPTLTLQGPTDTDDVLYRSNGFSDSANDWNESGYDGANICRSLLQFDLSSIPAGATIEAGDADPVLSLWHRFGTTGTTDRVFRSKRDWVETQITWTNYSTGNAWQTAGGFGADDCEQTALGTVASIAAGENQFTLTKASIQAMFPGGAWTNNGFLLKCDTESGSNYHAFRSSDQTTATAERPQLVVVYTAAGGANLLALLGVG